VKRLLILLCLAPVTGCLTDRDKADWADAVKDFHGDNMRMRTGPMADPPTKTRDRDDNP